MINLNEYQLKIIISIELLVLCQTLIEADSYSSDDKLIVHLCRSSKDCLRNSLCIRNDSLDRSGTCQCIPGYFQMQIWGIEIVNCIPISPKHYGYSCKYNQDCQHYDPNTICDISYIGPVLDPIRKCICADYHKYSQESGVCEPCDRLECVRPHHRIIKTNRQLKYFNNYFQVFFIFVFFFFGSLFCSYLMKKLYLSCHEESELIDSVDTIDINQPVFVALPQPVLQPVASQMSSTILEESPPEYEDLAQTIRLPTYKEALLIYN